MIVGWYGYDWWKVGRFIESTDDAYVGAEVTTIAAKVSGLIAQIPVTDNQFVRAGDLLVRLDDRDYRAAVAKAEAAVGAQEAALVNIEAMRSLQESLISQARADIDAMAAEAVRARSDQTRYRALAAAAAGSLQNFEKADAEAKKALAGEAKAHAALQASLRQIAVLDAQKNQVMAARQQAIAERDLARLNLGFTELRAPIDGFVGNRSGRVGGYAATGTQLLAIVPAQGLWVDANFKESQIAQMNPGQKVRVFADILPDETFVGHVESLAPATGAQFSILPPENATGNFTKIVQRVPVRIRLDGEGSVLGRLRPGLSVTAKVDLRAPEESRK
ncbi:hemolysin D [Beijerinckiaceae bacterium]|nr:hemolysin D [Beijerinckiaceae bacterium]